MEYGAHVQMMMISMRRVTTTTATIATISSVSRSLVTVTNSSFSAAVAAGTTTNSSISATNTGSNKPVVAKPIKVIKAISIAPKTDPYIQQIVAFVLKVNVGDTVKKLFSTTIPEEAKDFCMVNSGHLIGTVINWLLEGNQSFMKYSRNLHCFHGPPFMSSGPLML